MSQDNNQAIQTAFLSVVEAVAQTCPCAYPRVRAAMTFDSEKEKMGVRELETTQTLIAYFRQKGFLTGTFENLVCTKCASRYRLRMVEYSILVNFVACELVELKAAEIGAPVEYPMPLLGYAKSMPRTGGEEEFLKRFRNANENPEQFSKYMLQLR